MKDVCYAWNRKPALDGFSVSLPSNCVSAIVSTSQRFVASLIGLMAGTCYLHSTGKRARGRGTIEILGRVGSQMTGNVAVCPSRPILFEHLTILENIDLFSRMTDTTGW